MASNAPESQVFTFDRALYRLDAIKKACYRFLADYNVHIDDHETAVTVTLVERTQGKPKRFDADQLSTEVLDQELREQVLTETQSMRDLILAQAFSNMPLVDPIGEDADFREDPLNIAHPDRQKG